MILGPDRPRDRLGGQRAGGSGQFVPSAVVDADGQRQRLVVRRHALHQGQGGSERRLDAVAPPAPAHLHAEFVQPLGALGDPVGQV